MDRYLEAIEKEKEKEDVLNSKKREIIDSNNRRERLDKDYQRRKERIGSSLNREKKRKYYLQNRKSYLKDYLKKAFFFGMKVSASFLFILLGIKGFESFFQLDTFSLSVSQLLGSFFVIDGMMSIVEFRHVAKEFLSLTFRYKGNVDLSIDNLSSELENLDNKRQNNQEKILENQELLQEVEFALTEIKEKIEGYQIDRNQLIGNLVNDLDRYINGFQYQETDIHKVIEKKIH